MFKHTPRNTPRNHRCIDKHYTVQHSPRARIIFAAPTPVYILDTFCAYFVSGFFKANRRKAFNRFQLIAFLVLPSFLPAFCFAASVDVLSALIPAVRGGVIFRRQTDPATPSTGVSPLNCLSYRALYALSFEEAKNTTFTLPRSTPNIFINSPKVTLHLTHQHRQPHP